MSSETAGAGAGRPCEERLAAALEALAARDRLVADLNRRLAAAEPAEQQLAVTRAEMHALAEELDGLRLAHRVELAESEARIGRLETSLTRLRAPEPVAHDDLKRIKGIGPVIEGLLHRVGITTFRRLATLPPEEVRALGDLLGPFPGRMERERWQAQAAELAGRAGPRPGDLPAPTAAALQG